MSTAGVWIDLSLCPPAGAALGRAIAGMARLVSPDGAATPDRGWRDPACLVAAAIPVAAALYGPTPASALAAAGIGWLLLAIGVCDERTLRIPHLLWIAGIAAGLLIAWWVGAWRGVAARALGVAVVDGGLLLCAGAAYLVGRRPAIGAADYGVVAFVAAVCGPGATLDILLTGGVIALGSIAERQAAPGRKAMAAATSLAAVIATALFGVVGATAGATALAVLATRTGRTSRLPSPAPFGSCLAAAAILLVLGSVAWPRSTGPLRDDVVLHLLHPDNR